MCSEGNTIISGFTCQGNKNKSFFVYGHLMQVIFYHHSLMNVYLRSFSRYEYYPSNISEKTIILELSLSIVLE